MATQYCSKCGSILPSNSPICTECGTDSSKIAVQSSDSMEYSAPLSFTSESAPVAPPVPDMAAVREEAPPTPPDSIPTPPQEVSVPADSYAETGAASDNTQNYYQPNTQPAQNTQAPTFQNTQAPTFQNTQAPPYQNTQAPPPSGFQKANFNGSAPQQKTNQTNAILIGVLALVLSFFSPLFGVIAAVLGLGLSKKSQDPKPVRILCGIAIGISILNFILSIAGSFLEIFLTLMS